MTMTGETLALLITAAAGLIALAMLCGAGLAAWRGWLAYKRRQLELSADPLRADALAPVPDKANAGALIELAAVKERLRRLEAIASGVEL